MDSEQQAYDYGYDMEPGQARRWLIWIVGGLAVTACSVFVCSVMVLSAFLIGREMGCATQLPPTATVAQAPEPTPTVGQAPEPTPTASQAPEPTPTVGQPPEPVIVQPVEGKVGEEVTFDGSESRPGSSPIASYEWDFGDGNRGSGAVVTHIYSAAGTYQVTLTVTGEDGLGNTGGPVQIAITEADTPTPGPPVIHSFSVTPTEIPAGECADIAWSVSEDASLVQVQRNDVMVVDNGGPAGQQQDCLDEGGSYTYRLEAYGPTGESVTQEVMVSVSEEEARNPLADTEWSVSAMNINPVPAPDTPITARFDREGQVSGNGGCNEYSGPYRVDVSALSVGPLTGGTSVCGEDIDRQEQAYLTLLQSAAVFQIEGNQLIIRDDSGQEVLRYNQTG